MKIAIFGGSFNPVHNEHVNIVKAAKRLLGFDKIIVIPSFTAPDKSYSMTARAKERLAMCRLAFAGIDGVEVSDLEVARGGISYTYVTCRRLKKQYPQDDLYFIIGADRLKDFRLWREPEEILKCVTLAVCARENAAEVKDEVKKFNMRFKRDAVTFDYVGGAVSSTKIRTLAALGEDFSAYVPESVKKYILSHKLYSMPEVSGVKKLLTEERWAHTVRVALAAAEHCRKLKIYEFDAVLAAALHDCAKYLSPEAPELKGFVCPKGVPAPVVHQYSGAYVAEHTFGIKDESVLNAIRYHSSGRENMSALEKLIYLSDLLEDGRDFCGVRQLRKLFAKDVDECMLAALEHQLNYLEKKGGAIYSLTRRAYEYLKENYGS